MHEFAQSFINPSTGAMKTPWEVKKEADAELDAKLQKTWDETKAFKVTDGMINDWTGHRFVTTHRCFGEPCPKDKESFVQVLDDDSEDSDEDDEMQVFINKFNLHPQKLAQGKSRWEEGLYSMGDLQEHKYANPNAWIPNALPHSDYDKIENLHSLIYDHFDPHKGRFKSDYEVQEDAANAESKKEYLTAAEPLFNVPEHLVNDWTGDRWAKNVHTWGVEEHPPSFKSKEEQEADAKKFQEKIEKYEATWKKKDEDDKKEFKLDKKEEKLQKQKMEKESDKVKKMSDEKDEKKKLPAPKTEKMKEKEKFEKKVKDEVDKKVAAIKE